MISSEVSSYENEVTRSLLLDSSETEHTANDIKYFSAFRQLTEPIRVTDTKKKTVIKATHIKKVKITTSLGYSGELKNVLFSKGVRRIQGAGISMVFTDSGEVEVRTEDKRMNKLCITEIIVPNAHSNTAQAAGRVAEANVTDKCKMWHELLGDRSKDTFIKIKVNQLAYDNFYLKDKCH